MTLSGGSKPLNRINLNDLCETEIRNKNKRIQLNTCVFTSFFIVYVGECTVSTCMTMYYIVCSVYVAYLCGPDNQV